MKDPKEFPKWPHWLPKQGLNHYVAFYLPSKKADGEKIGVDREKLIEVTMRFLLIELGGATQSEGTGYFKEKSKDDIHVEHVTICKSFCSKWKLEEQGWNINRMANSMAIEFEQISLSVEVDGIMYFYEPTTAYKDRYKDLKDKWVEDTSDLLGYQKYLAVELDIPKP